MLSINYLLNSIYLVIILQVQKLNYCGGKTRLNPDLSYKDSSKPINRIDESAYRHDICYLQNEDTKTRNEV